MNRRLQILVIQFDPKPKPSVAIRTHNHIFDDHIDMILAPYEETATNMWNLDIVLSTVLFIQTLAGQFELWNRYSYPYWNAIIINVYIPPSYFLKITHVSTFDWHRMGAV